MVRPFLRSPRAPFVEYYFRLSLAHRFSPLVSCSFRFAPLLCASLQGLSILRNRGYDSAGVCTVDNDQELVVSKFASKGDTADSMALLQTNSANHVSHTVGIAHTRWATHGEGESEVNTWRIS